MTAHTPVWTPAQYKKIAKRAHQFCDETDDAHLAELVVCGLAHAVRNTSNSKKFEPHKTVSVNGIDIDTKIAPLITEMWKAGIKTLMSCEDGIPANFCWILFKTQLDANKFISIAVQEPASDKNKVWQRIQGFGGEVDTLWQYSWKPHLVTCNAVSEDVSVRFPLSDLEYIEDMFQKYNENSESKEKPTVVNKKRKTTKK